MPTSVILAAFASHSSVGAKLTEDLDNGATDHRHDTQRREMLGRQVVRADQGDFTIRGGIPRDVISELPGSTPLVARKSTITAPPTRPAP